MTNGIFEQLDFVENPMFEKIIDDLIQRITALSTRSLQKKK